jgi:hypothetical protein
MTTEEVILAGSRAQRLLDDPALTQAFADVRAAIIERWETAPVRDVEGQHELHLMLKCLTNVRENLELAVTNGKVAVEELKTRNRKLTPAEWRASRG